MDSWVVSLVGRLVGSYVTVLSGSGSDSSVGVDMVAAWMAGSVAMSLC